jgi:hypothetical protein
MDGGLGALSASLSLEELEAQITELAGHLNAANYRWLMLIAEFDRRKGWADGSLHSCAHWLNFKVGLNLGAAREKVRVAHALPAVPKIAAAMARGQLSYSKVRALTRVATEATEDTLLMIALHGTAYHVENTVRYFRQAQQAEELSRDTQQHVNRTVEYWYDSDGSLIFKARLPALGGAMLIKALDAALSEVPAKEADPTFGGEQAQTHPARRADALALLAEGYLHARSATGTAGAGADHHGSADHHQVIIHVDAETLRNHTAGRCHVEDGPMLPIETVRRLTCDASLVRITENEAGEPLDVGRKTRTIPPAIRRALNARDPGCCFPGCTHRRYLDAHHVAHWADGGETKLSNLLHLCRTHHRLVHEGGVTVERREGRWRFVRPNGREFAAINGTLLSDAEWTALRDSHVAQGIVIHADTAATLWRGERMDYGLGISILCDQAAHAKRAHEAPEVASASTSDVSAPDVATADVSAETSCESIGDWATGAVWRTEW